MRRGLIAPFAVKNYGKVMATIREAIKDAFFVLGVETDYTLADDDAYERAYRSFSPYLQTLQTQGLKIFTGQDFNNIDDQLPVIEQAYIFIYSSFALYVAPIMGVQADQMSIALAKQSENDMRSLWGADVNVVFPENLPIGSGNEYNSSGSYIDPFYPNCDPIVYDLDCDDECGDCCGVESNIVGNK